MTKKGDHKSVQPNPISIVITATVILIILVVLTTGFFGFQFFQTRVQVAQTFSTNSQVYNTLIINSVEYQLALSAFLTEAGQAQTTAEIDAALVQVAEYSTANSALREDFNTAQNITFSTAPNTDTQQYAQAAQDFVQTGESLFSKTGRLLTVSQCTLTSQKELILAQDQIASRSAFDDSSTQSMVNEINDVRTVISRVETEIATFLDCFDDDFIDANNPNFLPEIQTLRQSFIEMDGFLADIVAGLEANNLQQVQTAVSNLEVLQTKLDETDTQAADDWLVDTTEVYFTTEADDFRRAINNLQSNEAHLDSTYNVQYFLRFT